MSLSIVDLAKKYNKSVEDVKSVLLQLGVDIQRDIFVSSDLETKIHEKLSVKSSSNPQVVLRKKAIVVEKVETVGVAPQQIQEELSIPETKVSDAVVDNEVTTHNNNNTNNRVYINNSKTGNSNNRSSYNNNRTGTNYTNRSGSNTGGGSTGYSGNNYNRSSNSGYSNNYNNNSGNSYNRPSSGPVNRNVSNTGNNVGYNSNKNTGGAPIDGAKPEISNLIVEQRKFVKKKISPEEASKLSKKEKEESDLLKKIMNQSDKSKSRRVNKQRKKDAYVEEQQKIETALHEDRIIKCKKKVTIKELAEKMGINPISIVKHFFLQGQLYNINSFLSYDLIEEIAAQYNVLVEPEIEIEKYVDVKKDIDTVSGEERPPIVTIMGHVDHGKTSLLDRIRSSKVTLTEAGGITQKIGAYQIDKGGKKITFIDTPGHEAFMDMRARGASVTDIAILVVAADDSVMPQTKEAIAHAQFAKVPIIVAVNKIDKPEANVNKVKQDLAEFNIISTDWGGDNEFVEVSALTGQGIDNLLEIIILQSQIMNLKADPKGPARAVVIESKLDPHMGALADVIVQNGTVRLGDSIIVGEHYGKIRSITNEYGTKLKEALPSVPVRISGMSEVPETGTILEVVGSDKEARKLSEERKLDSKSKNEMFMTNLASVNDKEIRYIVKSGSKGSLEALRSSLMKINNSEVKIVIIHASTGNVNYNDLQLAKSANATIVAFESDVQTSLMREAQVFNVSILSYDIIYKLIEDIEERMKSLMAPKYNFVYKGKAEVLKIFKIPKMNTIAGCVVRDGVISNKAYLKVIRGKEVVREGDISSLKRLKDFIARCDAGQECGISINNYNDFLEGDFIEAYSKELINN